MRTLFVVATLIFWAVIAAFWGGAYMAPKAPEPAPRPQERGYTLREVARHASEDDCWMAIGGQVYDLTGYLPRHPADPQIILPWCGKEATTAYNTKTQGRPHTARADALLPKYRIGRQIDTGQ